jgi:glycosyltransferase involved in cell wall biosynthesis
MIGFMETANLPLVVAAIVSGRRHNLILSVHNNPRAFRPFVRWLMARLYPAAGRIVAVSHGIADWLVGHIKVSPDQVSVIHNPVAFDLIQTQATELNAEADHLRPFVFAAGRLVPQKNFPRMLRIFRDAAPPSHRLVIAGSGPLLDELVACAEQLGVADRVRFIGRVANPFSWMARAEALILTSLYEGWGNVLAEAMAVGCPVVSFDCQYGPAEITIDGACGVLVDQADDARFIEELRNLLASPARRHELIARGRERVRSLDARKLGPCWLESS